MKPRDEFYRDDMMGEEAVIVVKIVPYPKGDAATVVVRGPKGEYLGAKQIMVSELEEELDELCGTLTRKPAAEQQAMVGKLSKEMQAFFN